MTATQPVTPATSVTDPQTMINKSHLPLRCTGNGTCPDGGRRLNTVVRRANPVLAPDRTRLVTGSYSGKARYGHWRPAPAAARRPWSPATRRAAPKAAATEQQTRAPVYDDSGRPGYPPHKAGAAGSLIIRSREVAPFKPAEARGCTLPATRAGRLM